MRIVQVVHGLPPQDMAGTELLTLELSRALQARGHQVTVIARTSAPEAAEFSVQYEQDIAPDTGQDIGQDTGQNTGQNIARDTSDRGVRIIRIVNNHTLTQSFQSQYDNAFFDHTFRQVLRDCQADIVHFQHVVHLSAGLIPLVSDLGYPTILSLPDFFFACHLVHLVDRTDRPCPGPEQGKRCIPCLRGMASAKEVRDRFSYLTWVLKAPHRIVVPSAFLADRIVADFPFLGDRLTVIPPGLPAPDALAAPDVSPGLTPGRLGGRPTARSGFCTWAFYCRIKAPMCCWRRSSGCCPAAFRSPYTGLKSRFGGTMPTSYAGLRPGWTSGPSRSDCAARTSGPSCLPFWPSMTCVWCPLLVRSRSRW